MRRTHSRPLPAGEIVPSHALDVRHRAQRDRVRLPRARPRTCSPRASRSSATLFYVFVYTIWLKPRTSQNIVIGGAAGAVPVLVGWAAVKGDLGAPAWILFAVVFFWTPAHFWALAMKYRDDYARAGIPMLPVLKSAAVTGRQITLYAAITAAVTLTLGPDDLDEHRVRGVRGRDSVRCSSARPCTSRATASPDTAIRFFGYSNIYLLLVFAAVAADALITRR